MSDARYTVKLIVGIGNLAAIAVLYFFQSALSVIAVDIRGEEGSVISNY